LPLSHGSKSNQQIIYGSLTYGVWLCHECSLIHQKLFHNKSQMKSVTDQWNDQEIQTMIRLGSNLQVNESLERYIPSGWIKCSPTSTPAEKELWIRAKYESRLFSLPPNPSTALNNSQFPQNSPSLNSQFVKLPLRLLDYFVTVSVGSCLESDISPSPPSPSLSLEKIQFSPEIKMCYPGEHYYSDGMTTLPNQLGTFIYPSGMSLLSEEKQPSFFTFVLTDVNAVKMYGGVLHFSELIDSDEISHLLHHSSSSLASSPHSPHHPPPHPPIFRHGYRPKAIVLLSHYPFYNLFRLLLIQLYRISLSSCPLPLDHYLANIFEIPLPPNGLTEILYHGLPGLPLLLYRPPRNQLPMIDYSFLPLFTSLSIENILIIFSYLLLEHKLCFYSKNISLLTPIQECFLSLLFPFVWQGAYIPVLPSNMLIILDAPVPLIIGIHSDALSSTDPTDPAFPCDGLVMIDIDHDEVYIGKDYNGKLLEPCELPTREVLKLKEILMKCGGCHSRKPSPPSPSQQQSNSTTTNTSNSSSIRSTLPFPNNEHLIPLDVTSTSLEAGYLLQSTSKLNHYDTTVRSAETKVQVNYQCTISLVPKLITTQSSLTPAATASARSTPGSTPVATGGTGSGAGTGSFHFSSSSSATSSRQSMKILQSRKQQQQQSGDEMKTLVSGNYLASSLLSPSNNCSSSSSLNHMSNSNPSSSTTTASSSSASTSSVGNGNDEIFDVKEIRYAFLRFFVSVLRDYQQFLEETNAANAAAATKMSSHGSLKLNKTKSSLSTSHSNPFLTQLYVPPPSPSPSPPCLCPFLPHPRDPLSPPLASTPLIITILPSPPLVPPLTFVWQQINDSNVFKIC
jgi:hypothetical protein